MPSAQKARRRKSESDAFYEIQSLTSVMIPGSFATIGEYAFNDCAKLKNVTIPASVTSIAAYAFQESGSLFSYFFAGNAPTALSPVFSGTGTVYYLPGTTGWSNTYAGNPTALWNPQIQASGPSFGVQSNQFGFNITGTSNIPIVVEVCTHLANAVWTPLQSLTLTNGSFHFSEPLQTNSSGRIYRISAP